jgi:hypothetical protein
LINANSQASSNGDFVKPELPEFLQNMGPGLSPIKENVPVTLSWHDIRAQAPAKDGPLKRKIKACLGKESQGPKDLLKGVSGVVNPGEMCAIMGARYEASSSMFFIDVLPLVGLVKRR